MVSERVWFWVIITVIVLCLVITVWYAVDCCLEGRGGDVPPVETRPARTVTVVDVPVTPPPRGEEPVPRELPGGRKVSKGDVGMPELLIGGVPLVALIVALVELLKQTLGLESRYAPVTAVGMGIVFAVGIQVSQLYPGFGTWFEIVVLGAVAGLLACGIYSGTKATLGR